MVQNVSRWSTSPTREHTPARTPCLTVPLSGLSSPCPGPAPPSTPESTPPVALAFLHTCIRSLFQAPPRTHLNTLPPCPGPPPPPLPSATPESAPPLSPAPPPPRPVHPPDDEYLAVVIAYILNSKAQGQACAAAKAQMPGYSMHLTDVGGWLRSFSATDTRLADIFPRTGLGRRGGKRPRLSEFLLQPRFRPFFRLRDSGLRKSEKLVTLIVDKMAAATQQQQQQHSNGALPPPPPLASPPTSATPGSAPATCIAAAAAPTCAPGGLPRCPTPPLSGLPTASWDAHSEPLSGPGLPLFLFDYEAGLDIGTDMMLEAGVGRDQGYERDSSSSHDHNPPSHPIRIQSCRSSVSGASTSLPPSLGCSNDMPSFLFPLPPHPHLRHGADGSSAPALHHPPRAQQLPRHASWNPPPPPLEEDPKTTLTACLSGGSLAPARTSEPSLTCAPPPWPSHAHSQSCGELDHYPPPSSALCYMLWEGGEADEGTTAGAPVAAAEALARAEGTAVLMGGSPSAGRGPGSSSSSSTAEVFHYREAFGSGSEPLYTSPLVDVPSKVGHRGGGPLYTSLVVDVPSKVGCRGGGHCTRASWSMSPARWGAGGGKG